MRRETKENTPFVLNLCLNKLRVLECSELSLCLAPCVHKMKNAQCACAFSSDVFLEDCARTLQSGHVRFLCLVPRTCIAAYTAAWPRAIILTFHLLLELKLPWRHSTCFVLKVFQLLMTQCWTINVIKINVHTCSLAKTTRQIRTTKIHWSFVEV